jgi:hypothetical protein
VVEFAGASQGCAWVSNWLHIGAIFALALLGVPRRSAVLQFGVRGNLRSSERGRASRVRVDHQLETVVHFVSGYDHICWILMRRNESPGVLCVGCSLSLFHKLNDRLKGSELRILGPLNQEEAVAVCASLDVALIILDEHRKGRGRGPFFPRFVLGPSWPAGTKVKSPVLNIAWGRNSRYN